MSAFKQTTKKLLYLLCFVLIATHAHADNVLDKPAACLSKSEFDDLQNPLMRYQGGDYQRAIQLFENTVKRLSRQTISKKEKAIAWIYIADSYRHLNKFGASNDFLNQALLIATDIQHPDLIASVKYRLAENARQENQLAEAKAFMLEALNTSLQNDLQSLVPTLNFALAEILIASENYPEAKNYLQQSIQTAEKRQQTEILLKSLNQYLRHYFEPEQAATLKTYVKLFSETSKVLKEEEYKLNSLILAAQYYTKLYRLIEPTVSNKQNAYELLLEAQALATKRQDEGAQGKIYELMALLYEEEKSYQEAKLLIEEAIALMNEKGEDALSNIAMQMIERDF